MKALIVIDIQKGYIEKYDKDLLTRVNQRIQYAAAHEELIIYVKNTKKLRNGVQTNELAQDLNVCSAYILCKKNASAFSNDELLNILRQEQVTEVEIIGVDGNSCIANSAADAKKHGYKVVLPCQCIGVQNRQRFEKSKHYLREKGIMLI